VIPGRQTPKEIMMNRRHMLTVLGAGGCGAAALWAAQPLLRRAASRLSTGPRAEPKVQFGLFDVDCRELNEAGNGLQFRERVAPLSDRLNRLYAFSDERRLPLVFTTCCSGRMLAPDSFPDVLHVPIDAAQRQWEQRLAPHRRFYLEKSKEYDMFAYNGNAVRLVQALGVGEWVIFGNGFDLCINGDIRALLAADQRVCLLSDVYARAAPGYYVSTPQGRFETATPETEARLLAEFRDLGVRITTLEQFLASVA
jgi:hypothetical protein